MWKSLLEVSTTLEVHLTNFEKCHIWPLEGTTKGIWDLDGNHFGCIDCSYDLVLSNLSSFRGSSGVWGHFETKYRPLLYL